MCHRDSIRPESYLMVKPTRSWTSPSSKKEVDTYHRVSLQTGQKGRLLIVRLDDPKAMEGLPAHVQIMGKPMKDEELMEILKMVAVTISE